MVVNSMFIVLTCDLADGGVISSLTVRVPGHALDTVCSPSVKVIKCDHGVCSVHFEAGAGAFSDDAERVEDGKVDRRPCHNDGVVTRGGGVQHGSNHNCRHREMKKENLNGQPQILYVFVKGVK